jgi:NADPH:quinone reductase-like Zn-dependent oxidoreductase
VRNGGRAASTIGSADVDWFAQRKIVAVNLVMPRTPESSNTGLRNLVELLEQGRLRVLISSERPLADAVNALAESQAGRIDGKLVLTVA